MNNPAHAQTAEVGPYRVQIVGGRLVVTHPRLRDPVPLNTKQLERWIARQAREALT